MSTYSDQQPKEENSNTRFLTTEQALLEQGSSVYIAGTDTSHQAFKFPFWGQLLWNATQCCSGLEVNLE